MDPGSNPGGTTFFKMRKPGLNRRDRRDRQDAAPWISSASTHTNRNGDPNLDMLNSDNDISYPPFDLRADGITESLTPNQGYIFAFRPGHPDDFDLPFDQSGFVRRISQFSRNVGQTVPSLVYNSSNIHIMIAAVREDGQRRDVVLRELSKAMLEARTLLKEDLDGDIQIDFEDSLRVTEKGVMFIGQPTSTDYWKATDGIHKILAKRGIDFMQGGTHITSNWFTGPVHPRRLDDFFQAIEQPPQLGKTNLNVIDVGFYQMTPDGFIFQRYDSFSRADGWK